MQQYAPAIRTVFCMLQGMPMLAFTPGFSRVGCQIFGRVYSPSERCCRGGVSGEMGAAGSAHSLAADKLGKETLGSRS